MCQKNQVIKSDKSFPWKFTFQFSIKKEEASDTVSMKHIEMDDYPVKVVTRELQLQWWPGTG